MDMNEDIYTIPLAAAYFGLSEQTIRNWASEFFTFLEPGANPGGGRTRTFTKADMAVFSLIAQMRRTGATGDDIHAALSNGQRGAVPDAAPDEMQALVESEADARLASQIELLRSRVENITEERDKFRDENEKLRMEVAEMRAEVRLLRERVDDAKERGKLEGKLEALEEQLRRNLNKD